MLQGCTEQNITLLADPQVIATSIVENHEPLVDLKNQTIIAYGPSPEIPNNTDYTKMRKTVYEKLIQAQSLLPEGLKLCLYEGYRSLSLQEKLFNGRYLKVQNLHPEWSQEEVFNETMKLVSPVINQDGSQNIPPHSTGGAIDIYLIDLKGQPVDMGIQVKDWMEDKDGSLSQTNSQIISQEAQEHRKIMNQVLLAVGFINYPTEYWHWSYGDRYWAYQTGCSCAIYGTVE
ncbi:MAG: M15 family metallopeptidase [Proteobacteria bacterium]|nr:M15 family metallopeptidase [Pseudomonadota bacterium]